MTTGYASLSRVDMQRESKILRAQTKKITQSPAKARAFLIKAGILDKSGKLSKRYRD